MMENDKHIYIAIDLKSFYASVECIERNLNPLNTNLVVADNLRTAKTICLAVTPSLKAYGISGRSRLYQVEQKIKEVNILRKANIKNKEFEGSSFLDSELKNNKNLKVDYIVAPPRMALYMKYSINIYNIYLKYFSPEDIYVYSVDEIFCDITHYLKTYKLSARQLTTKVMKEVYEKTGITSTAGIGTNLYLCKVAMDIVAKHIKEDENGVRIACLDEESYRRLLWTHKPITDFWRVGKGYAKSLAKCGIYTMGDVAKCAVENEDILYKLFGVNAEILIDHSFGYEPCTIEDIKKYKPKINSISSGQVLHEPYNYEKTKLIIKEMTELLTLDLVEKHLITNQIVLEIGYDVENLLNEKLRKNYIGEITVDRYGRSIPKHAHGTINIDHKTSSTRVIMEHVEELFERIINKDLLVRRINITANNVVNENKKEEIKCEQLDLFGNYLEKEKLNVKEQKEREMQKALINIKYRYGKNAVIKGMNLEEGGTTIKRNSMIGGHKS